MRKKERKEGEQQAYETTAHKINTYYMYLNILLHYNFYFLSFSSYLYIESELYFY